MAKVILTADGQAFDIEDEIANDDELLKSVLKSSYPQLGDPEIKRETKGDVLTVRVTKRAGPKGAAVLEALAAAPDEENAGVRINRLLDEERARSASSKAFVARVTGAMSADVIAAVHTAAEQSRAVSETAASLRAAASEHGLSVPVGF